ncbi:hypothetical protein MAIC_51530 [Mycolicibacterium aichiense]|uniref:Uncharacterized protein n=1 Tax=Mycolicibacterium aichiense TaxID=1799 RepID=A0AAD1MF73_9MYCO|nr:hypothetical protein MAIC_51530 [Mycolicibacterium aichiense]
MDVPALRDAAPVDRFVGQFVAVDDRDGSIEVAEYLRGQQAAHAGTQNNGMVPDDGHPLLLAPGHLSMGRAAEAA